MNIKEEIFDFISTHESQISHDMREKDDNINVRFTTFGNRAGCRAIQEVIQMVDEDTKIRIVEMMRSRRVVNKNNTK